jgi:UDP-GlcNAc:undecaprenyl-phosphate/decaprenyl-phosphate GlcNAc-1-phosphate transferase
MDENLYLYIVYSFYFFGITIFALLINSIMLKFVKTLGTKNQNESTIRWSSDTKPAIGGIGFFLIFLISFCCYFIFFDSSGIFKNKEALGLMIAAGMAFLMGLADDAYNTRPFLKFFVQILCGASLITSGNYISVFQYDILNYAITIVWVIGIMNSINMLDNMDAITTVVSIFIIVTSLIYMVINHWIDNIYFIILIGILGSLIGFLFYNWHPSKIYMGDTGSQFLGIILAFFGVKFFWNGHDNIGSEIVSKQVISVLIIFLLPLVDTTVVVVNRISRGQSPFVGGKDHTTHNLSYQGLSDSQVAFTFSGVSVLSIFIWYFLNKYVENWTHLHTFLFSLYIIAVFAVMYYFTIINKSKYNHK